MSEKNHTALLLCVDNSASVLMAEALFTGEGRV